MLTWKDVVENKAHPGYYFVGDILDIRLESRYQSAVGGSKDHHLYQIAAYKICDPLGCSEKCISTGSNYS